MIVKTRTQQAQTLQQSLANMLAAPPAGPLAAAAIPLVVTVAPVIPLANQYHQLLLQHQLPLSLLLVLVATTTSWISAKLKTSRLTTRSPLPLQQMIILMGPCRILGLTALNSLLQCVKYSVWEVCSVN